MKHQVKKYWMETPFAHQAVRFGVAKRKKQ